MFRQVETRRSLFPWKRAARHFSPSRIGSPALFMLFMCTHTITQCIKSPRGLTVRSLAGLISVIMCSLFQTSIKGSKLKSPEKRPLFCLPHSPLWPPLLTSGAAYSCTIKSCSTTATRTRSPQAPPCTVLHTTAVCSLLLLSTSQPPLTSKFRPLPHAFAPFD